MPDRMVRTHTRMLACASIGKPCILEEFGTTSNQCANEAPWQATSLDTKGMGADMFWQYGDTLSTGQSPNDGNTIYYGTSTFTCIVTDHIAASWDIITDKLLQVDKYSGVVVVEMTCQIASHGVDARVSTEQ